MNIEVGKFYKGIINNCIIQIMAIKEEPSINIEPTKMAYYVDLRTNKTSAAPLKRLEHSQFKVMSVEEVRKELNK